MHSSGVVFFVCCTRVPYVLYSVDMKTQHATTAHSLAPISALFSQAAEEETDVEFVLFENLTLMRATLADVSKLPRLPHQRHCAGARRRVHRLRFGALTVRT